MNVRQAILTGRFFDAMSFAGELHRLDVRKGTQIPYLSHLMSVSALVLEHGGTEDQAIAGLLHDAAEDHGGQVMLDEIRVRFGLGVADIVAACTDSLEEEDNVKQPWWPRKVAYVDHLKAATQEALLVSAADKLHNARCILADYRVMDDELWERFNKDAGRVGSLWYYGRLSEAFLCSTRKFSQSRNSRRGVGTDRRCNTRSCGGTRSRRGGRAARGSPR